MPTIRQLIQYLAPVGTNPDQRHKTMPGDPWAIQPPNVPDYDRFPKWPPDLFAIAATLVNQSECYSHSRYAGCQVFSGRQLQHLRDLADRFRSPFPYQDIRELLDFMQHLLSSPGMRPPPLTLERLNQGLREWENNLFDPNGDLLKWWRVLVDMCGNQLVDAPVDPANPPAWWDAAMQLMIVADEACLAVGFLFPDTDSFVTANLAFGRYQEFAQARRDGKPWPGGPHYMQFPTSLCAAIPACKVCVQPKTHTVQVGCTINNLSRHVSLLPPHCQVRTEWRWGVELVDVPTDKKIFDKTLGNDIDLLVVPFPYTVDDAAFLRGEKCSSEPDDPAHFFAMSPTWLNDVDGRQLSAERFVDELLLPLIEEATQAGHSPEWLILPELALSESLVKPVADRLAAKTQLQLFITGFGTEPKHNGYVPTTPEGPQYKFARNEVFGAIFVGNDEESPAGGEVADSWRQAKHHRWKLERGQIQKYGLERVLDPRFHWWEGIEVYDRRSVFSVFRGLASMTTLVCEDLARIHPVQSVLRAVGPNLVVALLMDDEEWEYRWSPRYATVLADDPGSSVLAVTSLGLIHRACQNDSTGKRKGQESHDIAVWREAPMLPSETPSAGADGTAADTRPKGLTEVEHHHLRNSRAVPLGLPVNHHALVLTVQGVRSSSYSLDGRTDRGMTVRLRLMGRKPIPHPSMPDWARYPFPFSS